MIPWQTLVDVVCIYFYPRSPGLSVDRNQFLTLHLSNYVLCNTLLSSLSRQLQIVHLIRHETIINEWRDILLSSFCTRDTLFWQMCTWLCNMQTKERRMSHVTDEMRSKVAATSLYVWTVWILCNILVHPPLPFLTHILTFPTTWRHIASISTRISECISQIWLCGLFSHVWAIPTDWTLLWSPPFPPYSHNFFFYLTLLGSFNNPARYPPTSCKYIPGCWCALCEYSS